MQKEHKYKSIFCNECGMTHTFKMECGDRTCPSCQGIRRHRIIQRFKPVVNKMKHPYFITLTIVRKSLTVHLVRKLRKDFTKLRHRKKWTAGGGVYQIEIGSLDDFGMCNLHIHIIADFPERQVDLATFKALSPQDRKRHWLSRVWHDITGDSYIVDARRCFDARDALSNYLTKHMTKRVGRRIDADRINKALGNTRLIQGFGTLCHLGMRFREYTCPNCGAVDSYTDACIADSGVIQSCSGV